MYVCMYVCVRVCVYVCMYHASCFCKLPYKNTSSTKNGAPQGYVLDLLL